MDKRQIMAHRSNWEVIFLYLSCDLIIAFINVDFPAWVVDSLDREAARIGVTRQSIIKVWLVERLKEEAKSPLAV